MQEKPTPIWVKNPTTGKEYNVAPIFTQMNLHVFSSTESPRELELIIDSAIRYIGIESKSLYPEGNEMNTALHNLYELRDMFEAMEEKKEG